MISSKKSAISGHSEYLEIIQQPQKLFQFRYKKEITGKHGGLGYPTVRLHNFHSNCVIRCSLYQTDVTRVTTGRQPHPHKIRFNGNVEGNHYYDLNVSETNNFTAIFQDMGIVSTKIENYQDELCKRMIFDKELTVNRSLTQAETSKIQSDAEVFSKNVDKHKICLGFQTFAYDTAGNWIKKGEPVFSNVVANSRDTKYKSLKIFQMSAKSGPMCGGQNIMIFVNKVDKKNIALKLSGPEMNVTLLPSEISVHHQYGISFKTPPYITQNTSQDVVVQVQLFRPENEEYSQPEEFRYLASRKSKTQTPQEFVSDYPNNQQYCTQNFVPLAEKELSLSQSEIEKMKALCVEDLSEYQFSPMDKFENGVGMDIELDGVGGGKVRTSYNPMQSCPEHYDEESNDSGLVDDDNSCESSLYSESEDNELDNDCFPPVFDERCLNELSEIFDKNSDWKLLMSLMDLNSQQERFEKSSSPSRSLFNYLEKTMTRDEIIDIFKILDANQAILAVDEMLVREFDGLRF